MAERGKVTDIQTREGPYGTLYNVKIGNELYGAGKYQPKFGVGDYITFDVEMNGRYKNMRNAKLASPPEGGDAPQPAPTGNYRSGYGSKPSGSGGKAPADYGKNQEIISRQAAANTAVAWFNALKDIEALPISKTAKAGDRYEAGVAILKKLREDLYAYSQTGKDQVEEGDEAEGTPDQPEDSNWP